MLNPLFVWQEQNRVIDLCGTEEHQAAVNQKLQTLSLLQMKMNSSLFTFYFLRKENQWLGEKIMGLASPL